MCPFCLSTVALLVAGGTGAAGGVAVLFGRTVLKRRASLTSVSREVSVPQSVNAHCPLAEHRVKTF